ncbi:class I SAM-dependent methyltransferase [bacterium]|nr:class I SAM-dependent methyltransferase [bacterium]MBU1982985.1 class I SAM-dependent methyltransferase [bacterium]
MATTTHEKSEWFEGWFDEDYLALYAHRDRAEAERFASALWSAINLKPGSWVADMPCGAGRHVTAFAELGAKVVGMDLSSVMLKQAAEVEGSRWLVRGDLRRIPLRGGFDLVANVFTSIGYFESESDNRTVFRELARLLGPGGVLVVDVINPSYLRASFLSETLRELPTATVWERRELDRERRRIVKEIEIRRGGRTRTIRESVRLYEREELSEIAGELGLAVMEFWGDYDGSRFHDRSPRLILLAKKER